MKITIDTKEDSHSEIKKVINLLTHLLGEGNSEVLGSDSFSSEPTAESNAAFTNMFGNSEPASDESSEPTTESSDDETPSDDGDIPEIIPY